MERPTYVLKCLERNGEAYLCFEVPGEEWRGLPMF